MIIEQTVLSLQERTLKVVVRDTATKKRRSLTQTWQAPLDKPQELPASWVKSIQPEIDEQRALATNPLLKF